MKLLVSERGNENFVDKSRCKKYKSLLMNYGKLNNLVEAGLPERETGSILTLLVLQRLCKKENSSFYF